jgi:hypothetical protein
MSFATGVAGAGTVDPVLFAVFFFDLLRERWSFVRGRADEGVDFFAVLLLKGFSVNERIECARLSIRKFGDPTSRGFPQLLRFSVNTRFIATPRLFNP